MAETAQRTTAPAAEIARPTPTAPVPMPQKPREPIAERRFSERDFKQLTYVALPEKGTTIDDLLRRDYWANVAAKLRETSKIFVMCEDKSYYCELIVFATGSNWAEVRMWGSPIFIDTAIVGGQAATDYEIVNDGLVNKWIIRRRSTGQNVKADGTLQTEDAARAWLREYLNAQGLRTAA